MTTHEQSYEPSERARQKLGFSEFGYISAEIYKYCRPALEDTGLGVAGDMIVDYSMGPDRAHAFRLGWTAYIRTWQQQRYEVRGREEGIRDFHLVRQGRADASLLRRIEDLDAWVNEASSEQEHWERTAYHASYQAWMAKVDA